MSARPKKRYRLLLYKRYHQIHRGLSQFLIVLGVLLLAGLLALRVFRGPVENPDAFQLALGGSLAILFIGLARFMFTLLVSKTAYAECQAKLLKIQTPFFPLLISYQRIQDTRPSVLREIFPPEKYKHPKLLETYWGETVVVIDVKKLPASLGLLKALTGQFMFAPGGRALILLVDDWMAFSQQLDQALNTYRSRRAAAASQGGSRRPRR